MADDAVSLHFCAGWSLESYKSCVFQSAKKVQLEVK